MRPNSIAWSALLLAWAAATFAGPASITQGDEVVYAGGSKQTGISFTVEIIAFADEEPATGFAEGTCFDRQVRIRRALARLGRVQPERKIEALDFELMGELEREWGLSGGGNDPEVQGYSWWNYALDPAGTVTCATHGKALGPPLGPSPPVSP